MPVKQALYKSAVDRPQRSVRVSSRDAHKVNDIFGLFDGNLEE
jgi:hypothetical protein